MSTSLRAEARRVLTDGPVHTLDLARLVLGLSGHPGAASRAVFTLLGGDDAFRVDGAGMWALEERARGVEILVEPPLTAPSLDPTGRPGAGTGAALADARWAVVDVETTGGGRWGGDRIIEVGIVHVDGGAIGDAYETLVNPVRGIPPRIQSFTGITNPMVAAAPLFEWVAPLVAERLEGRVFVAHNVGFDWGFLSEELLSATGDVPEVERICTVRLGRLVVPRLRRYGLDSLAAHFGIPIVNRHRALGDAMATARLLLRLLGAAQELGIHDFPALREALVNRRRNLPRRRGARVGA